ncbi:MAG TPA: UvrD-helicase domain-containing protein [Verrucomicrobiae bacterium]|nr:UvrD-helicase domain-containing protein [Verrucomicrobiae bacterium]
MTHAQYRAITARGNVLVMAGAGTGKTRTLVERCLDCLCREQASLDEILVVTFTEAAASEMRQRLRAALEKTLNSQPSTLNQHLAAQLALFDAAHIGTLHGFCLKLVREHFYELGLDPQPTVLDESEAQLLANETLEEELQTHYAGENGLAEAVQKLIQINGGGRDEKIRSLVLRLHHYAQTRPDAEGWFARQLENFSRPEPAEWRIWLLDAIRDWRDEWLPVLENLKAGNEKADELIVMLRRLPKSFSRTVAAEILGQVVSADDHWPAKRKIALRKPLEDFFDAATFLAPLAAIQNGNDPLSEDWDWVRGAMTALLRLTQNFSARFAGRKRDDGILDFHDLEQFALTLLWDFGADKPTPVAERWREKIRFVFVDEYQDINAAQDKIIQALSSGTGILPVDDRQDVCATTGNRFLVGDVKQSIYRFRLADPKIFRDYAGAWCGQTGQTFPLSENFRSREGLLHFVNSVFALLMREEVGGVGYDAEAQLRFGSPEMRGALSLDEDSTPRAELLLHFKKSGREEAHSENEAGTDDSADLEESGKEARLLALRLKELKAARHAIWHGEQKAFRPVEWRDMAVLLRSPANKAEAYAKEFERAGVPLVVERGGFFDSTEILDLLNLLQLLDNPLQDVPGIAVLRSPLAGLSLDELAEIRLAAKDVHFWTALNRTRSAECGMRNELRQKIEEFLGRFSCWRKMARQVSLSQCLEEILAETHYAEWLPSRPRGARRQANVERFLNLARRFDQFQRQGLFRFLRFIEAQREAGVDPEVAPIADENAVRLMSIHQSKGLEFPVVAVADLAKPFNLQDLRAEIILDERFGLCPRVKPPHTGRRYPSLPHWLAQRQERRELLGEELRLLYVAMTRARDTLILSGAITEKKWQALWTSPEAVTPREILAAKSCADWLGLWFGVRSAECGVRNAAEGELPHVRWRIADDAELSEPSAIGHRPPVMDLPALDGATVARLRDVFTWEYPFAAATKRAAKSSVTALRRQAADETDDEAEPVFLERKFVGPTRRSASARTPKLSAAEAGSAHHKFIQHLALDSVNNVAALRAEAGRMEREKVLSAGECAALNLGTIAAFWNSPPGKQIRAQSANVRRELAFTAKFSPQELAEIVGTKPEAGLESEFVVVQGVADLVVLLPEEIWLVDFKTDDLRAGDLPAKTRIYTPQLKLYARALEKIYARPVSACWLHFLSQKHSVLID